jgi:hypothetical protein
MTEYFRTPERIERLQLSAELWKGTPWRANSCARGVGIACHNTPRALYIESGALNQAFPVITSTPQAATAANQMEQFIDGRPEFGRLKGKNGELLSLLLPGDLVGLFVPIDNVGRRLRLRCVNHLGVILPANWFVHTLMKKNTDFDLINVHPWDQTLVAAWRPLERV